MRGCVCVCGRVDGVYMCVVCVDGMVGRVCSVSGSGVGVVESIFGEEYFAKTIPYKSDKP